MKRGKGGVRKSGAVVEAGFASIEACWLSSDASLPPMLLTPCSPVSVCSVLASCSTCSSCWVPCGSPVPHTSPALVGWLPDWPVEDKRFPEVAPEAEEFGLGTCMGHCHSEARNVGVCVPQNLAPDPWESWEGGMFCLATTTNTWDRMTPMQN